ncbi:MAG: DUF4845 domain-containing protein [Steroidobacteraceae bacterium]
MRQRQRGMTFIGLLCILALAGVVVYAGIRLAPLYLNYMKVAKTMEAAATEYKADTGSLDGVKKSLDRHWNIEDITGIDYKDIEITKDENGALQMHVAYDDSAPYVANVSLTVHFEKTVKVQ